MKIALCSVVACLTAASAVSASVLVPGAYQWHMDGDTTAFGTTTTFHMAGESVWWNDFNLGSGYQDVVIGGTWNANHNGAYCELHKDRYMFVPGWSRPDDPADPDYGEFVNFMPYSRSIRLHAYALPGEATTSSSNAWYSESFRITSKVWQYWLATASSGDYARIFLGDTLVAGGAGKVSVSGLLGPGDYRVEIFSRVDAARNQTETAWGGSFFTIPSPGPLSLALLGVGLLCSRRRRAAH